MRVALKCSFDDRRSRHRFRRARRQRVFDRRQSRAHVFKRRRMLSQRAGGVIQREPGLNRLPVFRVVFELRTRPRRIGAVRRRGAEGDRSERTRRRAKELAMDAEVRTTSITQRFNG